MTRLDALRDYFALAAAEGAFRSAATPTTVFVRGIELLGKDLSIIVEDLVRQHGEQTGFKLKTAVMEKMLGVAEEAFKRGSKVVLDSLQNKRKCK